MGFAWLGPASLAVAMLGVVASACGTTVIAAHATERMAARGGATGVEVASVRLTDDVRGAGIGDGSALVVELRLTNDGARPRTFVATSFACLMEVDRRRPRETLSLPPGGGAEGTFPDDAPIDGSPFAPLTIAPGETRDFWVLFHGYRFANSEVPRRITLRIPADDHGAGAVELTLADPARGRMRWEVPPEPGQLTAGFQNTSLLGGDLRGTAVSTLLSWQSRHGRLLTDVGLASTLFVQSAGPLASATSSFLGTGLAAHLTLPLLTWGTPEAPRTIGVFAGGMLLALTEIQSPAASNRAPNVYGALVAEAGLELHVGRVPLAATPFPLSPAGPALPRFSVRLGYAEWLIGGHSAGGYTTSLRLAW